MKSLKEDAIIKFLSSIEWRSNNWSYQMIEESMRKFLGERPALDIKYRKEPLLLEGSNKTIEVSVIDKIYVIFTDTDDVIKKLEIKI